MSAETDSNPWLRGAHRPIEREIETRDLPVEGAIPPELSGSLLRIGPNPIGDPGPRHQWFVGHGMVHEIQLEGGQAKTYRNRWVRTPDAARRLGEAAPSGDASGYEPANTHVLRIGDGVFALTETCQPFRLGPGLTTLGRDDLDGAIPGGYTAHPHRDPLTGEFHAATYDLDEKAELTHIVLDESGKLTSRFSVELNDSVSVHDHAMTERFLVFYDLPAVWDTALAADGWPLPYRWKPDYPARVGVLERGAGPETIRWFEAPPGWVFHTVNAFDVLDDDGDVREIVCDVVRFERILENDITGPGDPYPPQLYRWRIDLHSGRVSQQELDPRVQEFPRIDERRWSQGYRYAVTTELFNADQRSGVLWHDLEGSTQSFSFEPGTRASEFVFVPGAGESREGEGWLLGTVSDAKARVSDLVLLDATDVTAGPIARVRLPHHLPPGFHGDWIPGGL